jgi:ubiquinone/menaquinone biosynthesis C-methylase UbiE
MPEASHWDRNYQVEKIHAQAISKRSHLVRRRLELYRAIFERAPGRELLEVGCAPGDWLVTFAREFGYHPTGIDFAPTGCAAVREKFRTEGIAGTVIEADFLQWEPGEPRFDVVFFQGSLEHFPDPAAGLRRAMRSARPGALVLAQLPCLAPWHINGMIHRLFDPEGLEDHFTRNIPEMEQAFRAAGLREVQSVRFGTLQLILNPRLNAGWAFSRARGAIALCDRLAAEVLNRTDAKLDLPFLSPHILTWGVV